MSFVAIRKDIDTFVPKGDSDDCSNLSLAADRLNKVIDDPNIKERENKDEALRKRCSFYNERGWQRSVYLRL